MKGKGILIKPPRAIVVLSVWQGHGGGRYREPTVTMIHRNDGSLEPKLLLHALLTSLLTQTSNYMVVNVFTTIPVRPEQGDTSGMMNRR